MTDDEENLNRGRELKSWLAKSNCQQYYPKFVEKGITFELLPELDADALREIGITKLGDRLRLDLAISSLKAENLGNCVTVDELFKMVSQITLGGAEASSEATLIQTNSSAPGGKDSNKNITFILQDGTTKRVNVTGCFNAQSIKRKILKRLGIKQQEGMYDTYVHQKGAATSLGLLFDVELVTICYSPDRLEKHRIIICPKGEFPTTIAAETSRRIMAKHERVILPDRKDFSQYHMPETRKQSNLRNFFGQRPPSELISSNLAEYFPDTNQKQLEATVRNSVRYSVRISRDSRISMVSNSTIIEQGETPSGTLSTRGSVSSRYTAHQIAASGHTVGTAHQIAASGHTVGTAHAPKPVSVSRTNSDPSIGPRSAGSRTAPTIGDVLLTNISAIDEAVAFKSPTIHPNDSVLSVHLVSSHRTSITASFAENNRYSRIELLNVDSDLDGEEFEEGDPMAFGDFGTFSFGGAAPKNWLKGARIGAGSFGTVYLGMNPMTGELMAVKQVSLPKKDGNNDIQKLMLEQQREMTLLKELNHENIVRYFGASTDENHLNIFLEYVPGGSVQSMLSSYGPFEEPLIRNFIRQVLIGLSYLHGQDIIHRDIKGANILIDIKGTVKIGDFGISKKVGVEEEADNKEKKAGRRASLQGSVYWMAPEVVKQTAYTKKADIWSVGCLIVEMFTGQHPFPEFSQMQAIFKIGTHITPNVPEWCTMEAKDFLEMTFEIDYEKRPDAIDMLSQSFLTPLIMSKE